MGGRYVVVSNHMVQGYAGKVHAIIDTLEKDRLVFESPDIDKIYEEAERRNRAAEVSE